MEKKYIWNSCTIAIEVWGLVQTSAKLDNTHFL